MITLASDFGTPYPAAMKGVILARTDARLVDVAHDFPRQDIRTAAFWLREVLPWFPPAVHLAVIDPGVGTDRTALAVRVGDHALVAPDNGVVLPAARELATSTSSTDAIEFFAIDDEGAASSTFHGRDVFAPAAAAIDEIGIADLASLDRITPMSDPVNCTLPDPALFDGRAAGEVLAVDGFGNVITNVPGDVIDHVDRVVVGGDASVGGEVPVGETFAAVDPGDRLATVGSHGNVELDVNRGRGDEAFGLSPGDTVTLEVRRD